MQELAPVRLTQDLGHELVVCVTGYTPRLGDKLNHVWYDAGHKKEIEMPPYCLTLLEHARANVYEYISASRNKYLEDVIKHSGPITQAMLLKAVQFSMTSEVTFLYRSSYISIC